MKLIFFTAFLFFCTTIEAQKNLVEIQDCTFTVDSLEIDFDRANRVTTYYYNGNLYNGCAKQDVPKNEMYYIHFIKEGRLERQLGFYYSGQKSRDYEFKNGYPHGLLQLFYDDGTPYIREEYKEGKLHGSLKRWKNGQLVREGEFWHGSMVWEKLYELKENKNTSKGEKKDDDC